MQVQSCSVVRIICQVLRPGRLCHLSRATRARTVCRKSSKSRVKCLEVAFTSCFAGKVWPLWSIAVVTGAVLQDEHYSLLSMGHFSDVWTPATCTTATRHTALRLSSSKNMPDGEAATLLMASAGISSLCGYYGGCTTCTASGDTGCYVLPLLHSFRSQANAGLQSGPCRGLRKKASFMRALHLGDARGGHHGPGQTANALRSPLYCGLPHEPASLHAVGVLRSRQCSAPSIGQAAICSTA